jgi:hypothetical protein
MSLKKFCQVLWSMTELPTVGRLREKDLCSRPVWAWKIKGYLASMRPWVQTPLPQKKKNLRQNNKEQRGRRERDEAGGRGEKWPKHCIHIWLKEILKNLNNYKHMLIVPQCFIVLFLYMHTMCLIKLPLCFSFLSPPLYPLIWQFLVAFIMLFSHIQIIPFNLPQSPSVSSYILLVPLQQSAFSLLLS